MAEKRQDQPPKQKTKPAKGQPVEIPVPKRSDFVRNLKKAARASRSEE